MEILNQFVVVPIDYGVLASPEKALCDVIIYTPQLRLRSMLALQEYLYDDLLFVALFSYASCSDSSPLPEPEIELKTTKELLSFVLEKNNNKEYLE